MTVVANRTEPKHLEKLVAASRKGKRTFLDRFEWPDSIEDDECWISDELLTIHGTEWMVELPKATVDALRKWESINFYAQNVHGERTLNRDLISRVYTSEYLSASPYIFHFIQEENEHMAMFAEFCLRYGELLPSLRIDLGRRQAPLAEEFLLFCRTILFEYYVDFYNRTAARDASLPSIVVQINRYHHVEEARHIAFSRDMIQTLFNQLKASLTAAEVAAVSTYVEEYMINQIELVYSTKVYEKAGIPDPAAFRKRLLQHPARRKVHLQWIEQPYLLLQWIGLLGARSAEQIIDGYFLPQEEALKRSAHQDPKNAIRAWLNEQAGGEREVTDEFDILDAGIVDSLKFMRFLVFIEQVSGKEMRLDEINLDDVRTLNAIEAAFL